MESNTTNKGINIMGQQVTPELQAYMTKIVKERGLTQEEFTAEVCGEVMQEATKRMDATTTRARESERFYHNFSSIVYLEITARAAAAVQPRLLADSRTA